MNRIDESRLLNPGTLRHRCVRERKTESTQNAFGEPTTTWGEQSTAWFQIKAMAGRELQDAQQRWAEARFKLRGHYEAGIERGDRLKWQDGDTTRYLDILDAEDPYGTRLVIEILAKEWVA